MNCDACRAERSAQELNLTGAGQWLCRNCFGIYQSRTATAQIRRSVAVRRCSCGAVITPHTDEQPRNDATTTVSVRFSGDPNGTNESLSVDIEKRGEGMRIDADVYACSQCSNEFRVQHPLVLAACSVAGAALIFGWLQSERSERWMFAALLIGVILFVGYEVSKRLRYPRVPS